MKSIVICIKTVILYLCVAGAECVEWTDNELEIIHDKSPILSRSEILMQELI